MRKLFLFYILIGIVIGGGITSCEAEHSFIPNENKDAESILVEVSIPTNSLPQTRATTIADENEIKNLYALAFNENDSLYRGYQEINLATLSLPTGTFSRRTFKMKPFKNAITPPDGDHDAITGNIFVAIIANVNVASIEAFTKNLTTKYKDILQQLVLNAEGITNTTDWERPEETGNWKGIPMWGTTDVFATNALDPLPTVHLIRALAKVEVVFSGLDESNFTPEHLYIYNVRRYARIMPNNDALDYSRNKVLKASYHQNTPDSIFEMTESNDIYPLKLENSYTTTFYIPEQKAYEGKDWNKNFAIIVKGTYTEGEKKSPAYYRLNLMDDQRKYIPVLRNHYYKMQVRKISYIGVGTFDDAKENKYENIDMNLMCDDGGLLHNASYGNLMLGVNRLEFHRDNDAQYLYGKEKDPKYATQLEVRSYYSDIDNPTQEPAPKGWTYEFLPNSDGYNSTTPKVLSWIKFEDTTNLPKIKLEAFTSSPTEWKARTAYIRIYSEETKRLYIDIKVVQYNQKLVTHLKNNKLKKYWLLGRKGGTGFVFRCAASSKAYLVEDNESVVVSFEKLSGSSADNEYNIEHVSVLGSEKVLFINTINDWLERKKDGKNPKIKIRFRSTFDPALFSDSEIEFFSTFKLGNYYITPVNPQFDSNKHLDTSTSRWPWYTAMGKSTGCNSIPRMKNAATGWYLPSFAEVDAILNMKTDPSYNDLMINLYHTVTRETRSDSGPLAGPSYLSKKAWKGMEEAKLDFYTNESYTGNTVTGEYVTDYARIRITYFTPLGSPVLYPEPLTTGISEKSELDKYFNIRDSFCISKVK